MINSALRLAMGTLRRLGQRGTKIPRQRECAVLVGNGPSAMRDLQALGSCADCDFWCVNGFALSEQFESLQPSHYVLADPAYWQSDNYQDLNDYVGKLLARIQGGTSWPMTLHLPLAARGQPCLREGANPLIQFRYFNNTSFTASWATLRNWAYAHELAMPAPQNVLIPSIYLATLAGYARIELLGADHSWHQDIQVVDSTLMLVDRHFYDGAITSKPFYKADGTVWRIADIFATWSLVHRQYDLLNAFSQYLRARIVNRTTGSFIDAFPAEPLRTASSKDTKSAV